MHNHTLESKKTCIPGVHATSPYKESVTNAPLPFPFSPDCFVLTQRRVQLHCIFIFSWRFASNNVDLTQLATTEKTHTANNQKLWLLEQVEFTSTWHLDFQISVAEPLWSPSFESGWELLWVWFPTERAIFVCACMCKFPLGYAYCSQDLVQTRWAASPHIFSLSQAHRLNFFARPDWGSVVTVAPKTHTYRPNAVWRI